MKDIFARVKVEGGTIQMKPNHGYHEGYSWLARNELDQVIGEYAYKKSAIKAVHEGKGNMSF